MTPLAVLDASNTIKRRFVRGLQFLLACIIGYGVLVSQTKVVAPAAISLGITFLPAVLRREYNYTMNAGLVLWITVAVFLHTIGSLELYSRYPWYDEITHTVSATLIAALGYAAFRAFELHTDEIDVPNAFRSIFIVVFVLTCAIIWEVVEFVLGGYFTVYGIDDIVTDMIANVVGALIVAIAGSGPVDGLIGFIGDRF